VDEASEIIAMRNTPSVRYCGSCGARLASHNPGEQCALCRVRGDQVALRPPEVPAGFWDTDQMRDALASWHIGRVINAYRHHPFHGRPLSQETVAAWLGITQAQLSRIEHGTPIRNLDRLIYWARLLRIPAASLWFDLPGAARHEDDHPVDQEASPDRHHPTATVATAGVPADLPALLADAGDPDAPADERLRHVLKHPGSVDLVAIARLRERVHELDLRYDKAPSTSLLADAGQCLGQVAFLRAHATTSRVHRELYAVEAEAATLMGQLVWDASQRRDHATARVYFGQAVEAARQVHDPTAEGLALLRTCFVALYGEKNARDGLSLAVRTEETVKQTSQVLTGLAVLHAAEALAMLGQQHDCERALSRAETHFGQIATTDAALDLFSPTQQGRLAGSCYLFLHDPKRAQPILERTAEALGDRSKPQAIVLGNLALACIRQGKLDEAAGALHGAIDVVETTWGGGGLNVVFGAARELRPWRQVPVVQDVYDRLLALMAAA
jgi:transcriptional regulator with XRE-family HTH domain